MTFTFLDMAGKTLFVRDDAERAQWTQEELHLDLEFPYVSGKEISTGQRVYFKDPATGRHQIYEIKQAKSQEPDHYQTISAEHICISELTDEHMDSKEVTNASASATLKSVLSGTLWSVGTVLKNPTSSADLSRGSVWQAVLEIKQNWNVYIEPRVALAEDGSITRRLYILPVEGTWNGMRLSINKNMLDPSVTIDDSEVVTALYGYGGTTTPTSAEEEAVEITFADVVWSKTSDHPAKPKGQKYLEDPAATKAYGRNGRARFGYYQNTDIDDPNVLLQKTWENLKYASTPDVMIEGTVADLYRLGYADTPIELHDLALVEVNPVGFKKQIQIIRMTVDLLDKTATKVTIGRYIPNIVYINHSVAVETTGEQGGRSGGGGGGGAPKQTERSEYETEIIKTNREIKLRAYQNDLNDLDNEVKLQEAYIDIQADRITQEVTDRRDADDTLNSVIEQTATQIRSEVSKSNSQIYSKITQTASQIRSEVRNTTSNIYSSIKQNADSIETKVSKDGIVSAINQTAETITISASKINLSGYVTASQLYSTQAEIDDLKSGNTTATTLKAQNLYATVSFYYKGHMTTAYPLTIDGGTYYLIGYR